VLKEIISQVIFSVKRCEGFSEGGRSCQEEVISYRISDSLERDDFSGIDMRGNRHWWKRMRWELVVDPENPWGDLSHEAESTLKSLLKG